MGDPVLGRTHEIFTTTNTFCQSQREMKKSGEDN